METATAPRPASHETPSGVLVWMLVEVAGTVVAAAALWNLFVNKLDATIAFFGETAAPDAGNVTAYRTWGAVLVVAVVLPIASSLWRRGSLAARLWHIGVSAVAAMGLMLFHVGIANHAPVDPEPTGPVCFSGGDSHECPGG